MQSFRKTFSMPPTLAQASGLALIHFVPLGFMHHQDHPSKDSEERLSVLVVAKEEEAKVSLIQDNGA
jgi:hypothetical protein